MESDSEYSFMSGLFLSQNYVFRLIRVVPWSSACSCVDVCGFCGSWVLWVLGFVVPGFLRCTRFPCMKTPHATVSLLTSVCAPEPGLRRDAFPGTGPLAQEQAPLPVYQATPTCSPVGLPQAQVTLPGASHSRQRLILTELVFSFSSVWRDLGMSRCDSYSAAR